MPDYSALLAKAMRARGLPLAGLAGALVPGWLKECPPGSTILVLAAAAAFQSALIAYLGTGPAWLALPLTLAAAAGAIRRGAVFLVGFVVLAFWQYSLVQMRPAADAGLLLGPRVLARFAVIDAMPGPPRASPGRQALYLVECREVYYPVARPVRVRAILAVEARQASRLPALAYGSQATAWIAGRRMRAGRGFPGSGSNGSAVACLARVQAFVSIAPAPLPVRCLKDGIVSARKAIIETHRRSLGWRLGDLLSAMVLGDRAVRVDGEVRDRFRKVGLSHLLAASGFNLTVVTASTWFVCCFVFRRAWICAVATVLAILAFVALAGPSASVVRAALMCLMAVIARTAFRRLNALAALALALLLTLSFDPSLSLDVGLQLSYAATIGIVCGAQPLSSLLCLRPSRFASALASATAVVMLAQSAVLPLQLYYFRQLGLLFLPANLLVAPLVPFVSVAGFASSLLALAPAGWLPPAACALADRLCFLPLSAMLAIAGWLSAPDWAQLPVPRPHPCAVLVYYACFAILMLSLRLSRGRRLAAALLAVAACALICWPA